MRRPDSSPFIHRRLLAVGAALGLASVLAAAAPAVAAHGGPLTVEVLVDGRPLVEHVARGTTYVEALHGQPFAIRLVNRGRDRIAVALAVDGRNTIDARRTTAAEARKWILEPRGRVVVPGWQVDGAAAHRFVFTTESRSYAGWLGDASQAGVIEAVVFSEKRPVAVVARREVHAAEQQSLLQSGVPGAASRAPAESAGGGAEVAPEFGVRAPSADHAATGFGDRTPHAVRRVRFEHEERPAASVRLRYEYRDALVELGVLPPAAAGSPLARREAARGFDDGAFCPVPRAR